MVKFKEYHVVTESNYKRFIERINDLLTQGWEPTGGVVVNQGPSYYQAMVKR